MRRTAIAALVALVALTAPGVRAESEQFVVVGQGFDGGCGWLCPLPLWLVQFEATNAPSAAGTFGHYLRVHASPVGGGSHADPVPLTCAALREDATSPEGYVLYASVGSGRYFRATLWRNLAYWSGRLDFVHPGDRPCGAGDLVNRFEVGTRLGLVSITKLP